MILQLDEENDRLERIKKTYRRRLLFNVQFEQLDRSTAAPLSVLVRKVGAAEMSTDRGHDDLGHGVVW